MNKKIYALLVGINKYANAPQLEDTPLELKGCLNDIQAFREYLENKSKRDGTELHLKELLNQEATRDALIHGFQKHLCQANGGDIALFYYSGHGSQEKVSPELRKYLNLEADLILLETLVCWDSRTENGCDLADKELAVLIAEISKNSPQIVVILDCCHAGGLVRNNLAERWFPSKVVDRPLSSFIFSSDRINSLFSSVNLDQKKINWLTGLQSRYILLAACKANELAREDRHENRGVFSYYLTDSLQQANVQASYRDIFNRTSNLVKTFCASQSPQITATNSEDFDRQFLGEYVNEKHHYFTVLYQENNGWVIEGGLLHGIQSNSEIEKTRVAIFSIDVENLRQFSLAIATAETIEVLPQLSKLNISLEKEPLNRKNTYKAVVISTPLTSLGIYLDGDKVEVDLVRRTIATANFGGQPSLYLCEVKRAAAEFYLLVHDSQYKIIHAHENRIEMITENVMTAIQGLEHIARWKSIATLTSPLSSRILSNSVQIQIYQEDDLEIKRSQIQLEYKYINNEWKNPAFRVKLTNNSNENLYFALLNLTESYAIKAIPLNGNLVCYVEAGESVWALDRNLIHACIPNNKLQGKNIKHEDILKLICNTSDFEACLLEQDSITTTHGINFLPQDFSESQTIGYQSNLSRLMRKAQNRAFESWIDETKNVCDDWVTHEALITTVMITNSIETQRICSVDSVIKMSDQYRQLDSNKICTEPQKVNYLAMILIGSILCLIVVISFQIWKEFKKEDQNKNRAVNYSIMLSKIIDFHL